MLQFEYLCREISRFEFTEKYFFKARWRQRNNGNAFPGRGAGASSPKRRGRQPIVFLDISKNCMTMKKIRPGWGARDQNFAM